MCARIWRGGGVNNWNSMLITRIGNGIQADGFHMNGGQHTKCEKEQITLGYALEMFKRATC